MVSDPQYADFIAWKAAQSAPPSGPIKLDLGCGNSTRRAITGMTKDKGWTGVDLPGGEGADVYCDLGVEKWPWPDSSVDEVNCAHMLEHVPALKRIHFMNELYRVLKPGGKAMITTPHWASCRAYGDVTHEWPPVSEMFWQYLGKAWREQNAPHLPFVCDFNAGYGYILAGWLAGRSQEYINAAIQQWKEAAQDMQATLTAVKP